MVATIKLRESVGVGTFYPAAQQHDIYMDVVAARLAAGEC
jgi:hypothetical protein